MTDPTSGPAGPSDVPGLVPPAVPGSGPVSERMRALLSKAVDEQVQEQRAVSTVLQDLRGQVAALGDALSRTASGAGVERVAADLAALAGDLRASTTSLAGRLEVLGRRVDEQATALAAGGSGGGEATAVRLAALAEDVESTGRTLEQLTASVGQLTRFPDAVAALQRDVAGLHDRLAPLADVRAALDDLAGRSEAEVLRPEIEGLRTRLDALPGAAELARTRDAVVEAVSGRLERLEALAGRPVATPDALEAAVGRLGGQLDAVAAGAPRLDPLEERLTALEGRLGEVLDRIGEVGTAAGGVPALAGDLASVRTGVEGLPALRDELGALRADVAALREDGPDTTVALGLTGIREDLEELAGRVEANVPPTPELVASAVAPRVAERLVDDLAPRVADVVVSRVGPVLVDQVAAAVSAQVLQQVPEVVRSLGLESERRVLAHVDEAVLALADALLRRRRTGRPVGEVVAPVVSEPVPAARSLVTGEQVTADTAPEQAPEQVVDEAPPQAADEDAPQDAAPEVPVLQGDDPVDAPEEPAAPADDEDDLFPEVLSAQEEPEAEPEPEPAPEPEPEVEDVLEGDAEDVEDVEDDAAQPEAAAPVVAEEQTGVDPTPSGGLSARERLAAAAQQAAGGGPLEGLDGPPASAPRSPVSTASAPAFARPVPRVSEAAPLPRERQDEDAYDDEDPDEDARRRRPWWRPGG